MAYPDGILIYSRTLREHKKYVRQVPQALSDASLHIAPEKCDFYKHSVKYLGFFIATEGFAPGPAKAATMQPHPLDVQRRFLGLANFYGRFIKDYSRIVFRRPHGSLVILTGPRTALPRPPLWEQPSHRHLF